MKMTMVGTGYVGLVTGVCFANSGNDVTCLDVAPEKIAMLNAGKSPIYETGLEELIRQNMKGGRLRFTTDKAAAYERAQVIFVCVGTPSDEDGRADLKYVLAAARDIGEAIDQAPPASVSDERRAPIVVVKSTVPVGSNAKVKREIASRTSKPFHMASNPEFLKEGAAINDCLRPDRVVLGCENKGTADRLKDLYEPFVRQGNPIFVMDVPSAEMVKYASNAMLATKISFINEIANLCEQQGADVEEVRRGMCADKRIGNQFLYPGLGYGGSCFPKDVQAVISMGDESGISTLLMQAVHEVNQLQRHTFLAKIDRAFDGGVQGKRFAVWGIAFKPGTDDIREAPSITLIEGLLDRGAQVSAYDPVAAQACQQVLGERVTYAPDSMSAIEGADALVICTDWDEFKHPDFDAVRQSMSQPIVFDGRNIFRAEAMRDYGFIYHSVGRAAASPKRVDERG